MSSVIAWILIFRAASLVISATLYFMVFFYMYCADSKGYLRYYSRVRFVLKTLLVLFYCVLGIEFDSLVSLTHFHIFVLVLLVLLDIAEMWSRSYRTFGYKEVKEGFGRASIWLV